MWVLLTKNQSFGGTCVYYIRRFKEIDLLIDHFNKYPLITQKHADYLLFKSAFQIINKKEYLTLKGFNELLKIKATMNKGLPQELKEAFPNITPIERPIIISKIPRLRTKLIKWIFYGWRVFYGESYG